MLELHQAMAAITDANIISLPLEVELYFLPGRSSRKRP